MAQIRSFMKLNSFFRSSSSRFFRDERGMSTIEYVILLAVIVVGAVSVWNQIGSKFKKSLGAANEELNYLEGNSR